jgi:hypothetical protein
MFALSFSSERKEERSSSLIKILNLYSVSVKQTRNENEVKREGNACDAIMLAGRRRVY